MVLYFCGLLTLMTAILSYHPIFQEERIALSTIFVILSIVSFYWFIHQYHAEKSGKRTGTVIVYTIFIFVLNLSLELIGLYTYIAFFSRWRDFTFLAPLFRRIFSFLRIPFGSGTGLLHLNGVADYVLTFHPNAGNMGVVYFWMMFFGAFSLFLVIRKYRGRYFLLGTVSLGIYLLFRVTVLVCLFTTQEVSEYNLWYYLSFFWDSIYAFLSFILWILALYYIFFGKPVELMKWPALGKRDWSKYLPVTLTLGLTIFFLLLLLFWVPSGRKKEGRVLFDEYYSDWSKSTRAIDDQWYGHASTYNYYTFRKFISSYYSVTVNDTLLENVDLDQYDVLLLKISTKGFSQMAIDRIVSFIKNGGGLWVIGDHTNVFGSSAYLNPLLEHFGVRLRYDAVYDNETGFFNRDYTRRLCKHPIAQNIPVFLFATPCSLQVDNPAMRVVFPGEGTKTYAIDYSNHNFFPDTKPNLNHNFGANILMAAGDFGQGRIAVFTDSTVFSNSYMYLSGKTELAINTIAWLNHQRLSLLYKSILFIAFIIFFCLLCFFYKRFQFCNQKEVNLIWLALVAIMVFWFSLPLLDFLNQSSYSLPIERQPLPKVGFIHKYSSIFLPYADSENHEKKENYHTFYIWGQRKNICTRYYFSLDTALKQSQAVFLILPEREFTSRDMQKVDRYLRDGGKVFVFDYGGDKSTANEFLKKYDIRIDKLPNGAGFIFRPGTDLSFENQLPIGEINGEGHIPLLSWQDKYNRAQKTVFTKKRVGDGELYIFTGVSNFSNQEFGEEDLIPKGHKKKINELILELYEFADKK